DLMSMLKPLAFHTNIYKCCCGSSPKPDEIIQLLQGSQHEYIRSLLIEARGIHLPLPIHSSTRIDIPKAKELTLKGMFPAEQILKILRYYIQFSESLRLESLTLANVEHQQLRGQLRLENLERLEIQVHQRQHIYSKRFQF